MKGYRHGDEILPGVVCVDPYYGAECTLVSIGESGTRYALSDLSVEHLESIAAELASLRARVPTEWRTGVPDFDEFDQHALMVRRYKDSRQVCGHNTVGWYRREYFNDPWDDCEWLVIEDEPPAPEKPKELTVEDLPDFEGRVKWLTVFDDNGSYDPWFIRAITDDSQFSVCGNYESKSAAVQAALDAVAAGKLDRWMKQD